MELFATDLDRLAFLLETDASLDFDALEAEAGEDKEATEQPAEKRPKYITNYIGSKQKLVDWIWKHSPEDAKSVVDAFSGSAVVAYMYKAKGLQVIANDRLRYCYHAARAIVENNSTRLTEADIDSLLADNSQAGTFVHDHFKGIFFAKGVHKVLDSIRANCDKLSGYKKDIALFGLGKTCMSGGFGHFSSSTSNSMRKDSPEEFKDRLKKNLERINALVFDNGKDNKAHQQEVTELLNTAKADLAYFDPPYATHFSTTNYEKSYHFVEGLMVYWKGLTIKAETKTKHYETDHKTVTKANANQVFNGFLSSAKHIRHWLISYRDQAYPSEPEMKKIISSLGRDSRMKSKDHHYSITAKHGDASNAKERLFICRKAAGAKAALKDNIPMATEANFHTSVPVDIRFRDHDGMNSEARESVGDPQFTFILCRTGTNKNGDHFTTEELSTRHTTAVNKKIDLKHSQELTDIVGGIIGADYLEDDNGGRVECQGELYITASRDAQLAHKLMKRGIITQVSMECDYEEGECSICGKRVRNKANYCPHLKKFKGREIQGKEVYEILHGVTFTGLGLLDRKGADENARITQVASNQEQQHNGESTAMAKDKEKQNKAEDEQEEKVDETKDDASRLKELEKENSDLKRQVTTLQKRIEELESEQKAAANRSRARKLMGKLEKQGIAFASDEEKETEFRRLTELSDDAFTATEAAYERMFKTQGGKEAEDKQQADSEKQESKEAAKQKEPLRSDAGVRPHDVDDQQQSLEDKLTQGFMAAYENRLGDDVATQN